MSSANHMGVVMKFPPPRAPASIRRNPSWLWTPTSHTPDRSMDRTYGHSNAAGSRSTIGRVHRNITAFHPIRRRGECVAQYDVFREWSNVSSTAFRGNGFPSR